VNLPIIYGERGKAFLRLQKEIMQLSDHRSLFDWHGKPSDHNSMLASRPFCFQSLRTLDRSEQKSPILPRWVDSSDMGFTLSDNGIHGRFPLFKVISFIGHRAGGHIRGNLILQQS
jgi:hypothetical protein